MAIASEFRFAARTLQRNPGYALAAVLTLALGIGANTAVFSVVDGVLLRPMPFDDMDRLMMVWETDRSSGTTREPASLPDYLDFRARSATFSMLAGFTAGNVNLSRADAEPLRLPVVSSTHELLPLTGLEPLLGRTFTAAESRPGGDRVVMIAEGLWERLYARDPDVLGRSLRLDEDEHTVIGVIPDHAGFGMRQILGSAAYAQGSTQHGGHADVEVWLPLQADIEQWPRSRHPLFVLGRLAAGVSPAAAQQEMTAIAAHLEASWSENTGRGVYVESLRDVVFDDVRPALFLLLAAVALVLLVACANVANLLLARGTNRGREIAVRASLGADGRRLARQFLAEGVLLALLGGAAGVALAVIGTDILLALAPGGIPRLDAVRVDGRVLAVTLAASVLVGIVFGLVPTLQARRVDVQTALRSESGLAGGARRGLLQSGLVVSELAFAVMLVVGAGLLLKSFWQIQQVEPGFRADGVLKAEFHLPASRYPADFSVWPDFAEIHRFNAALLERTRGLPGVEAVALAASHPLDRGFTNSFEIVGREAQSANLPEIPIRFVTPGYFDTVGLAVRQGRAFDARDGTLAPAVALINEAAARRLFANVNPIGQRIAFWGAERRIAGVVANEKFHGLTAESPMAVYTPLAQTPPASGAEVLLVRSASEPETLATGVRAAIRDIDPELAVFGIEPLRDTVGRSVAQERFTMLLLGVFAAVAVALSVIGIHGVLSYLVARRTPEIGIRMALGARRGVVLGMIAGEGARLAVAGLALGLAGAFAATRLLSSLLYGVTSTDPATFAAVAAGVFAVAMLACYFPARRAAKVDPMTALRQE
ncbi:MAG TPA: ABC transporter permease [Gammaproteobacteria bacterium]|nr:ABC transporter permease [Gammaproteobacteria bacterium]